MAETSGDPGIGNAALREGLEGKEIKDRFYDTASAGRGRGKNECKGESIGGKYVSRHLGIRGGLLVKIKKGCQKLLLASHFGGGKGGSRGRGSRCAYKSRVGRNVFVIFWGHGKRRRWLMWKSL